jgi:hypothetical protein
MVVRLEQPDDARYQSSNDLVQPALRQMGVETVREKSMINYVVAYHGPIPHDAKAPSAVNNRLAGVCPPHYDGVNPTLTASASSATVSRPVA